MVGLLVFGVWVMGAARVALRYLRSSPGGAAKRKTPSTVMAEGAKG